MKSYITLLSICCIINTHTYSAFVINKPIPNHADITEALSSIKASEFVRLSAKDLSLITGKKMTIKSRLSFSLLKMKVKHDLKKNPNLTMADYYAKEGKRRLSTLWIVLLTILGLILLLLIVFAIFPPKIGLGP